MAGTNILGYTKEDWKALSKKQRFRESLTVFKRNVLPAMLGGSLGASILSKDPAFRKLGTVVTAIGLTGAAVKIDPTNFAGSFEALKAKGANLLNFKKQLSTDQKNGLRILGEQAAVKSKLSFTGDGKAKIDTETNQDYEVEYDGWGQITTEIAEAKGLPEASAMKVAELVAKQPANKSAQVKNFLKRLWTGVYTNLPQIIEDMKSSGLDVPPTDDPIYDDPWDGTGDLPPETPNPTTEEPKILGIKQSTVLGGTALAALGYAVFKK